LERVRERDAMRTGKDGAAVNAVGERWRLYGLALGECARRWPRRVAGAARHALSIGQRPPDRLVIAPQDLRTADPTVAADIYAGYFAFAGRLADAKGRSPFELAPPSRPWAETLNGFVWLRHLRAADTAIARANARALVDDFLGRNLDRRGIAGEPRVAARRLISFLTQSPLVLDGADHAFYHRYMRALGRTVAQLTQALASGLAGEERLVVIVALAYAGMCLNGYDRTFDKANALLAEELSRQVLPDGAHIGRNPRVIIDLLLDLLPLRQAYAARGLTPPEAILGAIDRMMPMLRLFRHGDGSVALFNGMGLTAPDLLATLLVYDDARARGMEHAPYAGYDRLQAGGTVVIADVGGPPPIAFSREAHAGCLSFELSAGQSRIVVNCGTPRVGSDATLIAARSTAAHSTATVGDVSSCHFAIPGTRDALDAQFGAWFGPAILSGPRKVAARRETDGDATTLVASHDGYRKRFGLVHQRRWRLAASGERLEGEDRFTREGRRHQTPVGVAIRFHLHPGVKASRSQDGQTAMLLLPDGEAWAFEADGLILSLEESVFFAAPDGARRTEQVVVAVEAGPETVVPWRFVRLGRHTPR